MKRITAKVRARVARAQTWLSKRDSDSWAFVLGVGLSYEGVHAIYAPAANLTAGLLLCTLATLAKRAPKRGGDQ